jgi:opacity protein-like surface antigen
MMRNCCFLLVLCAVAATAQVGELSVSGGVSQFGGGSPGTLGGPNDPEIEVDGGFRLGFRFTLNTYRFFGHEFGYAYSRSTLKFPEGGGDVSVPVHQGLYNFLAYATPEGTRVRPFVTGGGHFSSFFPPGASVYYGNQITKFGFNYGGGIKARVTEVWGVRADFRQYHTGHPFEFPNESGMLKQTEITFGISFNF